MSSKTRQEILEVIRDAGARNARVEFMRIVSEHPLDFASAMEAFRDGLKKHAASAGECAARIEGAASDAGDQRAEINACRP